MQVMMGAVQEVKTTTDEVKDNIQQLAKNITALNEIAK